MGKGWRRGVRIASADRSQVEMRLMSLDHLLPEDHRARQVLSYVEQLDLTKLYESIGSVEGKAGRPAIDPGVLMTLWLYATLEDVGSARQLARLCESDLAYQWILGGLKVSHKTLSDFRVGSGEVLDELLSRSVAALASSGVVDLQCLAVDGMRLRASAGSQSFRREPRLDELQQQAQAKVSALKEEAERDPGASDRRQRAKRQRAAEDRARRIEAAKAAAKEIEAQRATEAEEQRRKTDKKKPPRGSTTDSEARIMRMPDGGWRPAYNARVTTAVGSTLVVGLEVVNNGSDNGQLGPTMQEIERRYGLRPEQLLADGGFNSKTDIEALHRPENGAVAVFCPWPHKRNGEERSLDKKDGPGTRAWHERMHTPEGEAVYGKRMMSERVHADFRNRGLTRVLVRGLRKVKAAVLWHVHAYNFLVISRLRAAA